MTTTQVQDSRPAPPTSAEPTAVVPTQRDAFDAYAEVHALFLETPPAA